MAAVALKGIAKAFGSTEVLKGVDLEIADGEFVVFVGPSGCGKSTLLRVLAGLEEATAGEVRIGDRRVNDLGPAERGIAMVFQSYALYPHLTVYENMAFALRLAKRPAAEIEAAVRAAAETLSIAHLLDRKPKALSGGQRQRVAIGRAIVRRPEVFLFDEPLSNLDAALRVKMRYEFAELHRRLGATMVYVTHDQVEAMTLADRIVVLSEGRVEQVGPPLELYRRPANLFVAGFLGAPKINLLDGTVEATEGGLARVRLGDGTVLSAGVGPEAVAPGTRATVGLRPESLRLDPEGALGGVVRFVEALGGATFVHAEAAGAAVIAQLSPHQTPAVGEAVRFGFDPVEALLFDADGRAVPVAETPRPPAHAAAG